MKLLDAFAKLQKATISLVMSDSRTIIYDIFGEVSLGWVGCVWVVLDWIGFVRLGYFGFRYGKLV